MNKGAEWPLVWCGSPAYCWTSCTPVTHFDAAIRCQAGDQLVLALDAVTLGAGDRIGFTTASMETLPAGRPLADQEVGHGAGTGFGQLQVIGVGADAVSVTHHHGAAVFRLDVDNLLIQGVERRGFLPASGWTCRRQTARLSSGRSSCRP